MTATETLVAVGTVVRRTGTRVAGTGGDAAGVTGREVMAAPGVTGIIVPTSLDAAPAVMVTFVL